MVNVTFVMFISFADGRNVGFCRTLNLPCMPPSRSWLDLGFEKSHYLDEAFGSFDARCVEWREGEYRHTQHVESGDDWVVDEVHRDMCVAGWTQLKAVVREQVHAP